MQDNEIRDYFVAMRATLGVRHSISETADHFECSPARVCAVLGFDPKYGNGKVERFVDSEGESEVFYD